MASLARRCRVNSSALEINVLSEASALMSRSALGNRRNLRDMGMTVFFFITISSLSSPFVLAVDPRSEACRDEGERVVV